MLDLLRSPPLISLTTPSPITLPTPHPIARSTTFSLNPPSNFTHNPPLLLSHTPPLALPGRRLRHPNIVNLVEVIDDPSYKRMCLLMEYCPGSALMPNTEDTIAFSGTYAFILALLITPIPTHPAVSNPIVLAQL